MPTSFYRTPLLVVALTLSLMVLVFLELDQGRDEYRAYRRLTWF
ncbi:MAG TPA: hypothetical protein VN719_08640 [Gemmatimonadales bacterium]|nr:hypothetical protein [Gemmatimonadales bacterium]